MARARLWNSRLSAVKRLSSSKSYSALEMGTSVQGCSDFMVTQREKRVSAMSLSELRIFTESFNIS